MRSYSLASLALAVFALGACQSQGGTPSLETENEVASYGIGLSTGGQLLPAKNQLEMDAFMAGVRDGLAEADPAIPREELDAAMNALSATVQAEQAQRAAEMAETNAAEGAAFLMENAGKEGVIVSESGLQYEILREGDGVTPGPQDRVTIHYKGTLLDGTQFDSSYDRGEPSTFGVSGVIPGFSEGLQLMSVGSHYKFYIPADIGYGPQGSGAVIEPNSTLVFEVELLEIVQ